MKTLAAALLLALALGVIILPPEPPGPHTPEGPLHGPETIIAVTG